VQVFDYGSEGGVPYIAMELLDGENLDARLSARGTLTPAELAKLFSELARGVGQAHAIGVIHRDLKPGNIFIAREGEHEVTKIVDFGIAKVKASALRLTQGIGTQLGTLLGTPQYMSPEQVRGSAIDHRTDLWALGVIACECLTGRCPFSGATIGDLTVQICTERPPAPSSLGVVPPGFDQWFFKATHKKPSKRFQSAEEMSNRLMAVLAPAVLTAPGAARAGRFIALPSRSEVRLAYSAVVTWKGSMMTRIERGFVAFRQVLQQVLEQLSVHWTVTRQKLRAVIESERFSVLRPVIEKHGLFASVALLCCGILLLGLTSRNGEPMASGQAVDAPEAVTLGLQSASASEVAPGEAKVAPVVGTGPAASQPPSHVAPANSELGRPVPADSLLGSAATADARDDVAAVEPPHDNSRAAALPHPASALPAPAAARSAKVDEPAPRSVESNEPRVMTKAMAQAAAKILNADDLVASMPPASERTGAGRRKARRRRREAEALRGGRPRRQAHRSGRGAQARSNASGPCECATCASSQAEHQGVPFRRPLVSHSRWRTASKTRPRKIAHESYFTSLTPRTRLHEFPPGSSWHCRTGPGPGERRLQRGARHRRSVALRWRHV